MPKVTVNNCEIEYHITGIGPDIVFIHGEDHSSELFDSQIPYFSRRYRCLTYDRRGHRHSELTPYGYSLHNQVIDLTGLLDYLGVEQCVIVAVAMATPIATTFALENPKRVTGLALVSWYELDGFPLMEERRRGKHPMTFGEFHMVEYEVLRDRGPDGLEEWFTREGDALIPILPVQPDLRQRVIRMIGSHKPEHFIKAAEFYTSLPNLVPRLDEIKCPIIGICGVDDPSPDNPGPLAGAVNFRQVWIEKARRFSMLEAPDKFNSALAAFLPACMVA